MKKLLILLILLAIMLPCNVAFANSAENHKALSNLSLKHEHLDITKIVVSYNLSKNNKRIEEEYIFRNITNLNVNSYGYITKKNCEVFLNNNKLETNTAYVLHKDGTNENIQKGMDVTDYNVQPFTKDSFKEYTVKIDKNVFYSFNPTKAFSIEDKNITFFDYGEDSFFKSNRDIPKAKIITQDENAMSNFNYTVTDIEDIYKYYNDKITFTYKHFPESYIEAYKNSFWYLTEKALKNDQLQFDSQIIGHTLKEYLRFNVDIPTYSFFNIIIIENESLDKYSQLKENFEFSQMSDWLQPLIEITLNFEDGYYAADELPAQFFKNGKNSYTLSTTFILPFAMSFSKAPSKIITLLNDPKSLAITILSIILFAIILIEIIKIIRRISYKKQLKREFPQKKKAK